MERRRGEAARLWFRSERFFRSNDSWYFHTREGFEVGPYRQREAAEADAQLLIDELKRTPPADVVRVIRNFILGMGGELDYRRDPAFTDYVVSEDDQTLEALRG
ncbi:MAG: hypothetical protein KF911_13630 [Pseudomonadales bacterium]|nr:hypothetical protein [Pseudomonadales bacterium]